MDALAFLELKKLPEPRPVYVLHGSEYLLKRQALAHLRCLILGDATDELAWCVVAGEAASYAGVHDELLTRPFLSPRKVVLVEEADPFVSEHRDKLERYLAKPSPVGYLVLDCKSWKSNTRLAKLVPSEATLNCEGLKRPALRSWLIHWTIDQHGQKLEGPAADLLIDLVGTEMGLLDQEVAKLAVYVGQGKPITATAVDELVGQSRLETAWTMLDFLGAGQGGKALETLHQLVRQGDDVHRILGAMSYQLRRLHQVARMQQSGTPLGDAMARAGLPPFTRDRVSQSLRQFGNRVYVFPELLVKTDLSLKSSDRMADLGILERLLIQLSQG